MDPLGNKSGQYGGSIREAGGAFGALEASREEIYFRQQDEQKLNDLRDKLNSDASKKDDQQHQNNQSERD